MLIPHEFSFATPGDLGGSRPYRRFCRATGLTPVPDGYGLLHAVDEAGNRHTMVCADVEYVRALAGAAREVLAGLRVPEHKFIQRAGWPDDWV